MNRHLNIFHTYTKEHKESRQLENDLTRAFALCLQEDRVLLHTVLKFVLAHKERVYENVFGDYSDKTNIEINIQENVANIDGFITLFAVSLSGHSMNPTDFFNQSFDTDYDPITDMVIRIKDVAIIFEVKPDNQNCTAQLYNQALNTCDNDKQRVLTDVVPVDLNWKLLMTKTLEVLNFKKSLDQKARFLSDFVQFIRGHNHRWLPVAPFSSIDNNMGSKHKFEKRLNAVLSRISDQHEILNYSSRIGLKLNYGWAQEIVIDYRSIADDKVTLDFGIWPGNTKGQGHWMHKKISQFDNWKPPTYIQVGDKRFDVRWGIEVKMCHFNGHVTGMIIGEDKVKEGKQIISWHVQNDKTGKYDRAQWGELESFLDDYIVDDFDWRKVLRWEESFVNTGRNYLTLSIGYEIKTAVPIDYLSRIDTKQDDLEPLADLIIGIKEQYRNLFNKQ